MESNSSGREDLSALQKSAPPSPIAKERDLNAKNSAKTNTTRHIRHKS
jgi:hypothetical protein